MKIPRYTARYFFRASSIFLFLFNQNSNTMSKTIAAKPVEILEHAGVRHIQYAVGDSLNGITDELRKSPKLNGYGIVTKKQLLLQQEPRLN
jgi:hypothetical protein